MLSLSQKFASSLLCAVCYITVTDCSIRVSQSFTRAGKKLQTGCSPLAAPGVVTPMV